MREKLDYIHANPVQRKLVEHPKDWPWSSWAHYAKDEKGKIRIDSVYNRRVRHPKVKGNSHGLTTGQRKTKPRPSLPDRVEF